ncbi:MAG: Gfo/Idh/MocA family oxidoreductase, partial [Gammaproteobacteria bacterium]|nr:Gfo/Idh/MocA family oxidoreductase [Gammaproteobacteria bacterium]
MKVLMIGHGAFAQKHMDGIEKIDGVEVTSICGRRPDATKEAAEARGIEHWSTDLDECLAQDVDCAIITSATQVHAEQAIKCLEAGKHVEVEIPMADTLADSIAIHEAQQRT